LARAELLFLVVLLAVPLVVYCRVLDRRERVRQFAVCLLAVVVVIGPW